jgi:hypothetical protein
MVNDSLPTNPRSWRFGREKGSFREPALRGPKAGFCPFRYRVTGRDVLFEQTNRLRRVAPGAKKMSPTHWRRMSICLESPKRPISTES